MKNADKLFDGSDAHLLTDKDKMREEFEREASELGFDIKRGFSQDYTYEHTLSAWALFLAAKESSRKELEAAKQRIAQLCTDNADLHANLAESNTWLAEVNVEKEALEKKLEFWQTSANEWKLAYVALGGTASESGTTELTKLLAAEREAARKRGFEEGKQAGRDELQRLTIDTAPKDGWCHHGISFKSSCTKCGF